MQRRFSLQEHIGIAKSSGLSVCVLDSRLKCVSGNGILNEGDDLTDMLHKRVELPVRGCYTGRITAEDAFHCVRIYAVSDESEPSYYLCEVLDSTSATEIAINTDIIAEASVALSAMRFHALQAERLSGLLCENADSGLPGVAEELRGRLDRLNSMMDIIATHQDMLSSPSEKVLFDVGKLCDRLCGRCNTALSAVGRGIALPLYDEDLFVCADGRSSVIVLMNIIRTAVASDATDCMPQMVVYRDVVSGSVVIKTINAPTGLGGADGMDALRMSLVKRYAAIAGGTVELVEGDRSILLLSLPAASPAEIASCRLEESMDSLYDTEIRRSVADILSCFEMTANVQ